LLIDEEPIYVFFSHQALGFTLCLGRRSDTVPPPSVVLKRLSLMAGPNHSLYPGCLSPTSHCVALPHAHAICAHLCAGSSIFFLPEQLSLDLFSETVVFLARNFLLTSDDAPPSCSAARSLPANCSLPMRLCAPLSPPWGGPRSLIECPSRVTSLLTPVLFHVFTSPEDSLSRKMFYFLPRIEQEGMVLPLALIAPPLRFFIILP